MSAAPQHPPLVHIPRRARQRTVGAAARRLRLVDPPRTSVLSRRPSGSAKAEVRLFADPRSLGPSPSVVPATVSSWSAAREVRSAAWHQASAHPDVASFAPATPVGAAVRITRRGITVLALLGVATGLAIVLGAWLSAPSAPSGAATGRVEPEPAVVVVQGGDSLWAIAGRLEPGADPRPVVTRLERVNHLADGQALLPGQTLRTR
ncbi:MAG: LysM peptidoglycan-binding domain-containing protein [Actinobacteria bacterium]|nr:LysM peptidoglycan-binding domain-containing protein [Actinomycetota bacterium]